MIDSHAEEALTELAGRFEHWRQSRVSAGERIPQALWDKAVALSVVLPTARVAKRLRLSATDLRKHRVAQQAPSATPGAEITSGHPRGRGAEHKRPLRAVQWALVLAAAVVGVAASGIASRLNARAALRTETLEMAVPSVSIIHPKRAASEEEIVLPGDIRPFMDAPIYARTNGYLRRWYVDIGAHVRAGQLLAEIDTPEIDQQLLQARADLATATANYRLAEITVARYQNLLKSASVSKQEADNATGDFEAKKAIEKSAQFNVRRLEELQSFKKIYAPFDGVITVRNIDIGALIDAGSNGGPARELFHIASVRKLRVYVNVPQAYSRAVKPGLSGELTLAEFPGRRFQGTLVRTAASIDAASRTLLAEIDVDNPAGELLTGAYAAVHLKLSAEVPAYLLPVNTLLFRSDGLRIASVRDDHRVVLMPVTLGRDFGTEVEVVAGLNGDESVVANPPDSLISGEEVRISHSSSREREPQ